MGSWPFFDPPPERTDAPVPDVVQVAETCRATRALGPGWRAVVWVQGCPLHCAGCVAPDWIAAEGGRPTTVTDLVRELLADERVTGLTFSGGEPMAQAQALAAVARQARRRRPLTLICFTGFRVETLRAAPAFPGVADLLSEVDVLIDGPYVAALNDGRGLRGSSNQRVHHLTDRLHEADEALWYGPRSAEVRIGDGSALLVGVPPAGLVEALDRGTARLAAARAGGARVGPAGDRIPSDRRTPSDHRRQGEPTEAGR